MLKDIRVHGSITDSIDYYATLAGEKLITAPFYEVKENRDGMEVSFFLAGMYFNLDELGLTFSGTGGAVSEYMFGSPMPLQDLGHKLVKNRLVFFGTFMNEEGLTFTSKVSGSRSYENLFLDGNALSNSFFLIQVPWPYSARRTQEVLLKTLGRVLKRSEHPGSGDDSALREEILRELAEPEATLLLLRLVHRPHRSFYQFLRGYHKKGGGWGDKQERFVAQLAEEVGVQQYQRERIAVDILYKAEDSRLVVDEYKDVLLSLMTGKEGTTSALARLNSLRTLAMRHGLPPTLFDTLDGLIPYAKSAAREEAVQPDYLKATRELFEGLFLSSKPPSEVVGKPEIAVLLKYKCMAREKRDNGFEQILLDAGRMLDERAAEGGTMEAFEIFSEVITYFDRLDNAEALVTQLAFMEHSTIDESKVRSVLGNKRALDQVEGGLFKRLVIGPILDNNYVLKMGRRKVTALAEGLNEIEEGEKTLAQIVSDIKMLATRETAETRLYEGIKAHLKQFYFNLSNPVHVRLLQREVEGELKKRGKWAGKIPEGAFHVALETVKAESEYVNNVLPKVMEGDNTSLREEFQKQSKLDLFRIEELEREYRQTHALDEGGKSL